MAGARHNVVILLLLAFAAVACDASHGVPRSGGRLAPKRPSPNVAYYELDVTVSRGAPSCGRQRPIILVNGLFMPRLEVNVNDTLRIKLNNKLPADFPQTSSGISIHFHGFSMWDNNRWFDGAAYVSQCPVAPGSSFTYEFKVDEAPGTYFWHDHSASNRADGLMGALIVSPARPAPRNPYPQPHSTHVVMLSDWWETEANVLAMQLNRPFDANKSPNLTGTGSFTWVGNAKTILVNGRGDIKDCNTSQLHTEYTAKAPYFPPVCNVASVWTGATRNTTGCTHEDFVVVPGKLYEFKIINAGALHYFTVCFEGHDLTVVAADTTPVSRFVIKANPQACIDVNSGQRYDVQLTANNPRGGSFWISVHGQTRAGVPSGYAFLRYRGSPKVLPPTPTPQNDMNPWTPEQEMQITTIDNIIGYSDNYEYETWWAQYLHRGMYSTPALYYSTPDKMVVLNVTQPLMQSTGAIRWAMNNVASSTTPPCAAIAAEVHKNPNYITDNLVPAGQEDATTTRFMTAYTVQATDRPGVYLEGSAQAVPTFPQAGQHIVQLKYNDVVDIVLNNLPANANNGDYTGAPRNASEQHPFHMHGHKFWVLGYGDGTYSPAVHNTTLNTYNPILRDTITLPRYGWAYIRLTANNPGVWPFHCHIMWHAFMGQQVYLVEAIDQLVAQPGPPSNLPECPATCRNNFAPYTRSWFDQNYPNTTYDQPN